MSFLQLPGGAEVLCMNSMRNVDTHNLFPLRHCSKCGKFIPLMGGEYQEADDNYICYACVEHSHLNWDAQSSVVREMTSASLSFSSSSGTLSSHTTTTDDSINPPAEINIPAQNDDHFAFEDDDNISVCLPCSIDEKQVEIKESEPAKYPDTKP